MPTEKPRFTITISDELSKQVDDYKFRHRIKNQTQAIISLIEKGFDALQGDLPQKEKTPAPEGAEDRISLEESTALLVELGYIRPGEQLSHADLDFLAHVIGLLDTWFDGKRP